MKYLIYAYDSLDLAIARFLSKEISRFDIRAEVTFSQNLDEVKQNLQGDATNIVIKVTSKINSSISTLGRRNGVKTCLIYQSVKGKRNSPSLKSIDLAIGDIPTLPQPFIYLGNCFFDLVKSYTDSHTDHEVKMRPQVAVVSGFGSQRRVLPEVRNSRKRKDDFDFVSANLESDPQAAIRIIQTSNAAVVSTNIAELVALHLNCPAVRINKSGFFTRNQFSILQQLTGKEVIPIQGHKKEMNIKENLNQILKDHNYCAGILQDYQKVKEMLGNEPAARKTARYIMDWLEKN